MRPTILAMDTQRVFKFYTVSQTFVYYFPHSNLSMQFIYMHCNEMHIAVLYASQYLEKGHPLPRANDAG